MSSSRWVDENGGQWRFSTATKSWKRLVNGEWVFAVLPPGGLRRATVADTNPTVLVVETMGPQGPPGPPGTSAAVSEVLSAEDQNGINDTFPLSNIIDTTKAVLVFRNGLVEVQGLGYLVTPTSVTFTTPPLGSDVLTVVYQKAQ